MHGLRGYIDAVLLPCLQDKLEVNGPGAHPLYQFLRQQQPASAPGQARPVPGGGGPGAIEW